MQRRMSELLRLSVDETLNARVEAYGVCGVRRNELSPDRMNPRAGHYDRKFHKQACEVSSSPLSVGISCEKKAHTGPPVPFNLLLAVLHGSLPPQRVQQRSAQPDPRSGG